MIRLLALCFFILAIFLSPPTANGDVSFSLSTASSKSYKQFIKDFRNALPINGKIYNIPVLLPSVSDSQRFTLINLSNYDGQTITVAIDALNVYLVAYCTGGASYFFQGVPSQASKLLFTGTQKNTLSYTGNYESLQTAAGKNRENIELGLPALDSAITTLYYYDSKAAAAALLVVIQTTSEAARYKYIEQQIANNVGTKFKPNLAIISLENKWSALSKQIQLAENNDGQFETPVVLTDPENKRVEITNVTSRVVTSNIALLLYKSNVATTDNCSPTTVFQFSIDNGREDCITW